MWYDYIPMKQLSTKDQKTRLQGPIPPSTMSKAHTA